MALAKLAVGDARKKPTLAKARNTEKTNGLGCRIHSPFYSEQGRSIEDIEGRETVIVPLPKKPGLRILLR
jgi:hypothetical protein